MLEAFHLFRCCLFLLFFFCMSSSIYKMSRHPGWSFIFPNSASLTPAKTCTTELCTVNCIKVRNFMSLQTLYRNLLPRITGVSKMSMRYKLILWHIQCFLSIDLERSCQVLAVQLPKPNVQPGSRVRTNSLQCQDLHRWPCSLTASATPAIVIQKDQQ